MMVQRDKAERGYGRAPSLDLEVGLLQEDQFPDVLGYVVGRQFLWLAVGIPLMAFASRGLAVAGYLAVAAGLLLAGVGISTAVMMRYGRPLRSWRLGSAVLAVSVIPVVYLWPSGPIQRWAGIRLPFWLSALTIGVELLLALQLVDRRVRGGAVYRMSPPPGGDAASLAWLDARVAYLESLLKARRVWRPERRDVIRALGHARLTRFNHPAAGQIADLHQAVAYFSQATAQTQPGARDEPGVYHDLAMALVLRANLELRGDDLEEALALMRQIRSSGLAEKLPARERDWVERWTYELLMLRFQLYHRLGLPPEDEAARAKVLRELTEMASEDRPDSSRSRILITIAEFHLMWTYESMPGRAVGIEEMLARLDQAIDAARSAEPLTSRPGDLSYIHAMLAHLLARRVRLRVRGLVSTDGADEDHEESKRYLALALADPAIARPHAVAGVSTDLARALDTAVLCIDVELSHGRWQEAIAIGEPALDALDTIVRSAIFRYSREEALRLGRGLHEKLGYAIAMADADQPQARLEVIRLIESGRAVLLREALGRSELAEQADQLTASGYTELAADVRALLSRISELEAIELSAHDAEGRAVRRLEDGAGLPLRDAIGKAQADFARLRVRTDEVLGAGADRSDFHHALAAAASAAPLCYLLHISRGDDGAGPDLSGLALVVSATLEKAASIQVVPLPGLTGEAVRSWHDRWEGSHGRAALLPGDLVMLTELLRNLGEKLIEPVFAAAGRPVRMVLLPDGLLSMLPLHAAAVRDGAGVVRPLCNHVVVTYAPTAVVLRSCQVRAAEMDARGDGRLPVRLVGIADPGGKLRGASPEICAAARHFATTEMISDDATPQRVLAAVTANARADTVSVVHFACHARAEVGDPLSSRFELAPAPEGQLRLADLLGTGLGGVRAAVLSACETGILGAADPDQYVSLAAGFVQIGAAGVIGTLSRVADPVAFALISRFYEAWAERPADPAMALSAAQTWLATARPSAIAAALEDVYPRLSKMDAAQFAHPGHWAPFFFLGA